MQGAEGHGTSCVFPVHSVLPLGDRESIRHNPSSRGVSNFSEKSRSTHTHRYIHTTEPPLRKKNKLKKKNYKYRIGNKNEYLQPEKKILINYWKLRDLGVFFSENFLGNLPELPT